MIALLGRLDLWPNDIPDIHASQSQRFSEPVGCSYTATVRAGGSRDKMLWHVVRKRCLYQAAVSSLTHPVLVKPHVKRGSTLESFEKLLLRRAFARGS